MITIKDSKVNTFNDPNKLPRLGRDEIAVFRLLGMRNDPHNKGKVIVKSARNVPVKDTIVDPTSKDGDAVSIAYIVGVGQDNSPLLGEIWFEKEAAGHITLSGNNLRHRDLYTYLMLSNFRADNTKRDSNRAAIYELVNEGAKAEESNKQRSLKREAMNVAAEMSPAELREFVAGLNQDETQDEEVLRNIVGDMAEQSPEQFMTLNKSEDRKIRADIKYATQAGIVTYSRQTRKFTWAATEDEIVTIPRQSGQGNHLDGFVSFIKNHKNGPKVYEDLKALITEKKAKK